MIARAAVLAAAVLAFAGARAIEPPPAAETKDWGLAVGPFLPLSGVAEAYDFGVYASFRGFYFPAKSRHGVRTALWGAFADGSEGIDDGLAYGGEMDYAAHFGAGEAPFYFFLGVGYCGSDFIAVSGGFPGGTQIHIRGSSVSGHAGVGYVWKRVFVEASYTQVFDDQKSYGFLPVTLGIRF